jgi:hypothetical protein
MSGPEDSQPTLWDGDPTEPEPDHCDPHTAPLAGCVRCESVACPVRRHNRSPAGLWAECWHPVDRENAHALGEHRWCLPGDAEPLDDADPYGENADYGDDPDRCRWAARWRAAVLALVSTLPEGRPLGVVLLDPVTGPRGLSSHESYRTAGPARTRAGRRPGELIGYAKGRAVVICTLGHVH